MSICTHINLSCSGFELLQDVPDLDYIIVPISGIFIILKDVAKLYNLHYVCMAIIVLG